MKGMRTGLFNPFFGFSIGGSIPAEQWPILSDVNPSDNVFAFIDSGENPVIQFLAITWSTPPTAVTFHAQCAKAQVSSGSAQNPYISLNSIPGSVKACSQDLSSQFIALLGTQNFIENNYLPMRIVFIDAYNRVHVAYEEIHLLPHE